MRAKHSTMTSKHHPSIAFFGSSQFSVEVLTALAQRGYEPSLLVTTPDRPAGRGQRLTAPPPKIWAESHSVEVLQPTDLSDPETVSQIAHQAPSSGGGWDLFIVASYGKILPKELIYLPRHQTLNVHPSLLPKLRGPSPIQTAILTEDRTGVTIIRLDERMDHGPIVAQREVPIADWPPDAITLEQELARVGGELLAKIIPSWVEGSISERSQDDSAATYSALIKKEDALLDREHDDPESLLRKVRAYRQWPRAYFFAEHSGKTIRVIVTEARLENGEFIIENVIPEGKSEMPYQTFLKTA